MRLRFLGIVILTSFVTACSMEKGSLPTITSPSITTPIGGEIRPLSYVTGTWTGSETASYGESGSLSVSFTQTPTPDAVVAANITWTSAKSSLTFNGTLTGTLSNMIISTSSGPCGYSASGTLNEAGTQITGSYSGTGPDPCPSKAGTFVLNGTSYVPPPPPPVVPVDCGTTTFYVVNVGGPNDNGDNARKNKCENTTNPAGIYVDNVTIGGVDYHNVCKFSPNPPGAPGNDLTFISSTPNVCPTSR